MGEPQPPLNAEEREARYLGCDQACRKVGIRSAYGNTLLEARATLQASETRKEADAPKPKHLEVVEYVMTESLGQVVEKYNKLVGPEVKIKEAKTPFIDENLLPDPQLKTPDASSGDLDASPGDVGETYEEENWQATPATF